ncbi:ribonuclease T2 family protein [Rhizobium sp. TRM95796]|uniref:ribonuclease T2 family protein n=1 Tax=Rhizobium sp. TRM95796 TaxID=2979862 RepID=UPI0021E6E16D|nr:ribonuclease [Rhizobium sp. TRM95796]MCV3764644.1 ribonuclease [Rhizobium sp. TRM95796]
MLFLSLIASSLLAAETEAPDRTVMALGLSWHPAFCEGQRKRPECADGAADGLSARQFSLHGLWVLRKTYCGATEALKTADKAGDWLKMPALALDPLLARDLAAAMPGVASGLDRHEWVKHGLCSGGLADDYFRRALGLTAEVNRSAVGALFVANIGKTLDEAQIKSAFDKAFGAGSGDKVKMRCRKDGGRRLISGLSIGLGAEKDGEKGLGMAALLARAKPTKFGCPSGIVDAAGLQ